MFSLKKASGLSKKAFLNYAIVIVFFLVFQILVSTGNITSALKGQLIPIACYMIMAVSLNLVVGISGELSLGHAGFMAVGAFTGILVARVLERSLSFTPLILIIAILAAAFMASIAGFIIGIPILEATSSASSLVVILSLFVKGIAVFLLLDFDI